VKYIVAILLVSTLAFAAERPDFDHVAHGKATTGKLDMAKCSQCHAVKPDGANVPPGANGHQPCMQSGCHVRDFLEKGSTLCLTCHTSSDNFRKNPLAGMGQREHHVEMSHTAHMKRKTQAGGQVVCQTCHTVDPATFRAVVSPGHPQCASCHAKLDAAPMSACDGCHQPGDPASYFDKQRKDVELKPRAFVHERVEHRFFDPGKESKPIQCDTCHYRVTKFASLRDLKGAAIIDTNTMKNNCSQCHDVRDTRKCTVCHVKGTVISTFNYHGL
jgi:hypothetical protein